MTTLERLPVIAADLINNLRLNFPERPAESQAEKDRYALGVAEETGELIGAYNRLNGSRRSGSFQEFDDELADVLITAAMLAVLMGRNIEEALNNKLVKIYARGWRNADSTPGVLP